MHSNCTNSSCGAHFDEDEHAFLLRGIAFSASLASAAVTVAASIVVYFLPQAWETAKRYFSSVRGFTVSCLLLSNLFMAIINVLLTLALPTKIPFSGSGLNLCIAQGFFVQFLNTSAMMWTMLIGIVSTTILMQRVRHRRWQKFCFQLEEYKNIYAYRGILFIIGFGLPLAVAIFAAAYGMIGPPEDDILPTWCWMNSTHPWVNLALSYFSFYIVSLAVDVLLWVYVLYHFWNNHQRALHLFFYMEVLGYLFFFIVAYIFGFANRLMEYMGEEEVFALQICQVFFQTSILIPNLTLYLISIYSETSPFQPIAGEESPLLDQQ